MFSEIELEIVKMGLEMAVHDCQVYTDMAKSRGDVGAEEALRSSVVVYQKVLDKVAKIIEEGKENG